MVIFYVLHMLADSPVKMTVCDGACTYKTEDDSDSYP